MWIEIPKKDRSAILAERMKKPLLKKAFWGLLSGTYIGMGGLGFYTYLVAKDVRWYGVALGSLSLTLWFFLFGVSFYPFHVSKMDWLMWKQKEMERNK